MDRYYDADGTENAGKKVFKIVLNNLAANLDQKQIYDYTWLYATLALVFSATGSLVWFLIVKNRKHKKNNI